ncbi:Kinase [Hexamita inflata]|uniref:non-specific serine/threonine protein kinase n=1 Tax=Hexamita inflata TaxID=28002 RepID=A0AA86TU64_9EUKA|nr:AGC NDR [Hexamita inflata]
MKSINNYIDKIVDLKAQRAKRMTQLNATLLELKVSEDQQNILRNELNRRETENLRQLRQKVGPDSYEKITTLGHGGYGQVFLVRYKQTKQLYAMKVQSKALMTQRKQLHQVRAERDLMASSFSNWVIKLQATFQDEQDLYIVMEYSPGGDLMGLLMRQNTFPEAVARFYTAEIIEAFNDLHKNNVIYRDGKPDNILITSTGHIKLTDFGLSCRASEYIPPPLCACDHENNENTEENINKQGICSICGKQIQIENAPKSHSRLQAFSTVGTQNYTAVEVLRAKGYTEKCDFWAAGCILFECLFGYPPFQSQSWKETKKRILYYQKYLEIPNGVSKVCEDFIRRLICEPEIRMGYNEVISHPFMQNIDFKNLHKCKAPFIPKLKSEIDTAYFDQAGEEVKQAFSSDKWWDDTAFNGYSHRAFPQTQVGHKDRPSLRGLFDHK